MKLSDSWPFDFVEVVWDDADTATGWEHETNIEVDETPVTNFGFLIKKTRKHIIVGSGIYYKEADGECAFNNRTTIPRGMVKKITVLVPKNTEQTEPPTDSQLNAAA